MTIEDTTLPTLYCPFPSAVNPHREAVHEHTFAWARRFGLMKDEAAIARLQNAMVDSLVARAYPRASRDPLAIITDWLTWLFVLDDECDEAEIGKRPERLAALQAKCLKVLSSPRSENRPALPRPRIDRPDVALIQGLYDLRGRMETLMSRAWMDRYAVSIAEYFEAGVWEARNRELGVWPDSATYTRMRPFAGGMYILLDLIDLTESDTLPLVARKHPYFQRLMLITSNAVLWCNDLFSLPKERAHHDMHNLALDPPSPGEYPPPGGGGPRSVAHRTRGQAFYRPGSPATELRPHNRWCGSAFHRWPALLDARQPRLVARIGPLPPDHTGGSP